LENQILPLVVSNLRERSCVQYSLHAATEYEYAAACEYDKRRSKGDRYSSSEWEQE
jgi:hypothetical protein